MKNGMPYIHIIQGGKMPYYKICEKCGATLDPGEKCTCEREHREEQEQKELQRKVEFTKNIVLKHSKRRKAK